MPVEHLPGRPDRVKLRTSPAWIYTSTSPPGAGAAVPGLFLGTRGQAAVRN
jgi:hypothetical protein